MKNICRFIAVTVCLGIASAANATVVGFSANILDPSPPGGTFLSSDTFPAPFSACSAFSQPSAPTAVLSDFCFEGINATGIIGNTVAETWTALDITIQDPNNVLGLNDASCGTLDPADSIFGSSNCSETNGVYTLDFSGGSIQSGQSFFIALSTPNVSLTTLDSLTTSVQAISTPEPGSLTLLASGTTMFGMLLYFERRRLLRHS